MNANKYKPKRQNNQKNFTRMIDRLPVTKSKCMNCNPLPSVYSCLWFALICGSFSSNLVVYFVVFGDMTWKLSIHDFVISVGQCSFIHKIM